MLLEPPGGVGDAAEVVVTEDGGCRGAGRRHAVDLERRRVRWIIRQPSVLAVAPPHGDLGDQVVVVRR